jgi:hypothetical protein
MMQFGGDDVMDEIMVGFQRAYKLTVRMMTKILNRQPRMRMRWRTVWCTRMIG